MTRYWGQITFALAAALVFTYWLLSDGYGPLTAGLLGVVGYSLVRWLIAWLYRIKYWHNSGGIRKRNCRECGQHIYRKRGDWVAKCYQCGRTVGLPGLRWIRHSVPAVQLKRTIFGPAFVVVLIVVLLVGSGVTAGIGVTEFKETFDDTLNSATEGTSNNERKTFSVAVAEDASPEMKNGTKHAIQYWNENGSNYLSYEFEFKYIGEGNNPDIIIQPTEYPLMCSTISLDAIGCAPVLGPDTITDRHTVVDVVERIPGPAARATVKHELGHVLGLTHSDEPHTLMSHEAILTKHQQTAIDNTDTRELKQQIEKKLNAHRTDNGENKLSSNKTLRQIAHDRAQELANRDDTGGTVLIDLECEIELDGRLYLPKGDAGLYTTQLYRFQSMVDVVNYSNAEYMGGPSDAVDETISRWQITDDSRNRAEHYDRHGVGVHISDDGDYAAVRAIC